MTRPGSLVCVLVCVGTLGAGCASGSFDGSPSVANEPSVTAADPSIPGDAAPPPDAAAPESDTPAPTTSPPSEEEVVAVEEPAVSEELAVSEEPAADEPRAEVSVFPPRGDGNGVARWTVEIIEWFPHDPEAFTQGLEVAGGTMYESTGLRGRSSLRTVNSVTGEIADRVDLPAEFFGEGLTVVGDEIVQLTWQSGTALVYDRFTLELVGEHGYEGEGWGLCLSGDALIMSNGSDQLARRDPETFELLGTVTVTAYLYPV